jgi:hypothetical protein
MPQLLNAAAAIHALKYKPFTWIFLAHVTRSDLTMNSAGPAVHSRVAKAAREYKGRPASLDAAKVQEMHAAGAKPGYIARDLKMARSSVYRLLGA